METKEFVLSAAFWISFAAAIILILLFVFGNSPTIEQIVIGIAVPVVLDIYKRFSSLDRKISKLEESNSWIRQSLERIEHKIGK